MNSKDIGRLAVEQPNGKSNNQPAVNNPLSTMQPGEQVLFEIKRHPIGLAGAYLSGGLLLITLVVICYLMLSSNNQAVSISAAVFMVAATIITIFLYVVSKIYWGNRWVVTSDSITQIARTGLFNNQSSQLSLEDLEDATAEQDGVLAHFFNFGVLKAETAGERSKFMLLYCPKPTHYAQQILEARERFMQRHSGSTPGQTP